MTQNAETFIRHIDRHPNCKLIFTLGGGIISKEPILKAPVMKKIKIIPIL